MHLEMQELELVLGTKEMLEMLEMLASSTKIPTKAPLPTLTLCCTHA